MKKLLLYYSLLLIFSLLLSTPILLAQSNYEVFVMDEKEGIKDTQDSIIIAAQYDKISPQGLGIFYAFNILKDSTSSKKQHFYIDLQKKIDGNRYDEVQVLSEKVLAVRNKYTKLWTLLDRDRTIIDSTQFAAIQSVEPLRNAKYNPNYILLIDTLEKKSLFNFSEEKVVTTATYDHIYPMHLDRDLPYVLFKKGGKIGFLDKRTGEEAIEASFDKCYSFEKYFLMVEKEGKRGLLTEEGFEFLTIKYDNISDFQTIGISSGHFLIAERDGKHILFNRKGERLFKRIFDKLEVSHKGIKVFEGNKVGLVYPNGQVILNTKYDNIEYFKKYIYKVKRKNKFGLVKKGGKTIFKIDYDEIKIVSPVAFEVTKNGKTKLVDINNKKISLNK